MKKAKNKSTVKKTVDTKSNAKKPKGITLKLENFGEVLVDKKLKFQKDLALGLDKLFSVEETIRKEIIPTISNHFYTYINWLKKNSPMKYKELEMKTLKKFAWDLVGYKRKMGIGGGRKVANESFEANVGRACKVALLMEKGKLTINKKNVIQGVSKDISPLRFFENSNGAEKSEPNPSKDIERARIGDIEDMFNRFILGKVSKYSSKNSKKKEATPKGNKFIKTSVDSILNAMAKHLGDVNVMKDKKLAEITSGRKAKYKSIALSILRILAKISVVEVDPKTSNVTNSNEVQFTATTHLSETWARKHFATAIKNVASEPAKVESK